MRPSIKCPSCGESTPLLIGWVTLYADEHWHEKCQRCGERIRCTFTARKESEPIKTGMTA